MITVDKERKVKDNKTTVKIRASIEMNVEVPQNVKNPTEFAVSTMKDEIECGIVRQSFDYDDFNYEVLEINNESSIEEKVNYIDKEI